MPWLSVSEAARYVRKRRRDVEALLRQGIIPASGEGGRVRVSTEDLDAYMRRFPYRVSQTASCGR